VQEPIIDGRLEVRPNAGEGRGKGVFAMRPLTREDIILKEPPLVAIQEEATKGGALVCDRCFQLIGSIEAQLANRMFACADSDARQLQQLHQRMLEDQLPLSEKYSMPPITQCPNNCGSMYCSQDCADDAWKDHHCLLCPQGGPLVGTEIIEFKKPLHCHQDRALDEFYEHALNTNEIFKLAAKLVVCVVLKAKAVVEESGTPLRDASKEMKWSALLQAWKPFQMGQKGLWWECIALPEDVAIEEEELFRAEVKEMAIDSLTLFKNGAMKRFPDIYESFPALFTPHLWGSIIGMFELNNLSLVVSSPVPAWAQEVLESELPNGILGKIHEAIEYFQVAGGLEGIVENEEEWLCLGNAFYSLQSCINHSCVPNAHAFKREEDKDGAAVILALRDIEPGEEITICYVDADASLQERTRALNDYGFLCGCEKCEAERLADELTIL
jgi:hypothetical protein